MLVKICGLSNVIDAAAACRAGADALGFVMGGRVLPCEVEPRAQEIRPFIRSLAGRTRSFLVTHLCDVGDISDLAQYLGVSGVQVSEPLGSAELARLRSTFGGEIIKTVVVDGERSFAELHRVAPFCDFILLDSKVGGYIGGTGATSDWELCRRLIAASPRPVFLAGGLTPENVREALRSTRAAGADVSTGVSTFGPAYLRKDRKDSDKIGAFVRSAREAAV